MLTLVSGRVFALLAFACLAACNTYNDSLLAGPSIPAAGESSGGESTASAGSGDHGGDAGMGAGGRNDSGGRAGDGHAGMPVAEAGSGGSSGNVAHAGEAGSGGSLGGGAGSAGMPPTAGSGGAPTGEQIDDFEDQDEFILRVSSRNGPWYVFSDGTATGTLGKLTIAPLTGADVRPSGTSTAALHLTATGFTVWGAGVGADMVNQMAKKAPYDVSAYRGIRFYAKIASGATPTVKVLLPNIYSDVDGGKCVESSTGTMRCGDHLFKSVSGLKTTWAMYEVLFSELAPQGFGLPQPATFDPTGVYSVQFTQANTLPVDLWLDDVTFVLK
jgi:hypothetical protein